MSQRCSNFAMTVRVTSSRGSFARALTVSVFERSLIAVIGVPRCPRNCRKKFSKKICREESSKPLFFDRRLGNVFAKLSRRSNNSSELKSDPESDVARRRSRGMSYSSDGIHDTHGMSLRCCSCIPEGQRTVDIPSDHLVEGPHVGEALEVWCQAGADLLQGLKCYFSIENHSAVSNRLGNNDRLCYGEQAGKTEEEVTVELGQRRERVQLGSVCGQFGFETVPPEW
jgi:hypothetical protein